MNNRRAEPTLAFAALTAAAVLSVAGGLGLLLAQSAASGRKASLAAKDTYGAVHIAEAGARHAVACLNHPRAPECGGSVAYVGQRDVPFGDGSFSVDVEGSNGVAAIVAEGVTSSGKKATVSVEATTAPRTIALATPYAAHAGEGGVMLGTAAIIRGPVFALGDVDCEGAASGTSDDVTAAGEGSTIRGCAVGGDARADAVIRSKVAGDAFIGEPRLATGTTVEGTAFFGAAAPAEAPFADMDIERWMDAAEGGGVMKGGFAPIEDVVIGPAKIEGDLALAEGVDLTLSGPLWVTGGIILEDGASIHLLPSFGDRGTVIVAGDPAKPRTGIVTFAEGSILRGSGEDASRLVIVSLHESRDENDPAIASGAIARDLALRAVRGAVVIGEGAVAGSALGRWILLERTGSIQWNEKPSAPLADGPAGIWRMLKSSALSL